VPIFIGRGAPLYARARRYALQSGGLSISALCLALV